MKDDQKEEIIYEDESRDSIGDSNLDEVQSKIKKLKEKLKKCSEEKQEYLSGWQREKADFINYKRRQEELMGEWIKMANAGLVNDLLAVVDTLEAAVKNQESRIKNQEGAGMILKQVLEILRKHGLEGIKSAGEKFNPEFHEAVEQVESDKEEGIVIEEIQKGYMLNGRAIRASKVKVSKKRPE